MTLGSGFRVLIVEDEILLAMELQWIIEDAGHQVVGHALDSRAALLQRATEPRLLEYSGVLLRVRRAGSWRPERHVGAPVGAA